MRLKAQEDFTRRCKVVADDVKHRMIVGLAEAAGVELPETPPQRYAPMSWDQARMYEERGMILGPHGDPSYLESDLLPPVEPGN
jgi:hypothetical protein